MQYYQPSAAPHKVVSASGKVKNRPDARARSLRSPPLPPLKSDDRRVCAALRASHTPEHGALREDMAARDDGLGPGVSRHVCQRERATCRESQVRDGHACAQVPPTPPPRSRSLAVAHAADAVQIRAR
jgi:hypothetical protein